MKILSRDFTIGILMILATGFFSANSVADETHLLLDSSFFPKQYLLQISGTVMNETFSGAQALLVLTMSSSERNNPYEIIIQGFPKRNSRNSFFWDADYTEMTAISNEITSDIKRTFVKPVPMFFVFLSPELLRHTGRLELLGDEGTKFAEKTALPTLINARAGKLKLRIHSNSVSGTIWMKGYDPVEHAFVQYSAQFSGKRSYHLQPKQEVKK
jgi:hypothetical protein